MKFSEFLDVRDGTHDSPKRVNIGKKLITTKNLEDNRIDFTNAKNISLNDFKRINERSKVDQFDILLSMIGTVGNVYQERSAFPDYAIKNLALLKFHGDELLSNWMNYYLQSKKGQSKIHQRLSGSTQQYISLTDLRNIEITLPNRDQMELCIKPLRYLDDLILKNNQINDNLLDFLDTEFSHQFLGERNFPSGKVKNFITIKRGASPRPIKDFLSENGRSWVKISDVTKLTTPFLYRTEQYIKESGIKKSRTIKPGTLILSNSATPGIPVISEILASVHDGWLIIDNYSLMDRNWFYLFFRQMRNSLVAQANGSVFNNLKTNIVKEFPVPIVDKSELTKFHKISNPIFEKLNQIQQENIELNRIKQTLLSQYFQ